MKWLIGSRLASSTSPWIDRLICSSWISLACLVLGIRLSLVVAQRLTGWLGASLASRKAYCRIVEVSLTAIRGIAESISIVTIGEVLKAPSIFLSPRFCRVWYWLLKLACFFYQITDP